MKGMKTCVLVSLLLAGVRCIKDSLFIYRRLGGDVVLPCTNLNSSSCSFVSWTFYKGGQLQYWEEVSRGHVRANSDKSNRMSIMSNCSLALHGLQVEDAGSYVCQEHQDDVTDVYLSLFTVTSPSGVMELRPGGRLVLSCLLFTYYDAGSCKLYTTSLFKLSWHSEDGAELKGDRHQLVENGRCNVTVVTTLQAADHSRRWRCQLNATNASEVQFMDFRSRFWSEPAHGDSSEVTAYSALPISRVVLCVALPLMVVTLGLFTWRLDHRNSQGAAAGTRSFRLQEIS